MVASKHPELDTVKVTFFVDLTMKILVEYPCRGFRRGIAKAVRSRFVPFVVILTVFYRGEWPKSLFRGTFALGKNLRVSNGL